jgi:TRAP transporter TAXI family solute receptor
MAPGMSYGQKDLMTIACYKAGTSSHIVATAVSELLVKELGVRANVETSGSVMARIMLLRHKDAQFLMCHTGVTIPPTMGVGEFDAKGWGPQRIRFLWKGGFTPLTMAVKATSDIHSFSDLKGKRVGSVPGSVTTDWVMKGALAFGNLDWGDVTRVQFSDYNAMNAAFRRGEIDITWVVAVSPLAEEANAVVGIRWLEMPFRDKEAWDRYFKSAPFAAQLVIRPEDKTMGPKITKPLETAGNVHGMFAYDFLDDDLAYNMTKTLANGYNYLSKVHPILAEWTISEALKLPAPPHPFHQGSIKYFKEKGLWTEEHEKWQTKKLQEEAERENAWKKKNK